MKKYIVLLILLFFNISIFSQIKISQLPALTGAPNTASLLPIVDYTTSITKKITVSDLLTNYISTSSTSYVPITARKAYSLKGGVAYKIPFQVSADSTAFITTPTDATVLSYTTAGGFSYLGYASTVNTANALVRRGASGEFTAGVATLSGALLNGNLTQSGNYSIQNNFTSGFGGGGYRLDYGVRNGSVSTLEIDNLTVRKNMSVYELLIRQIRATNGNIFVSASAQIDSVLNSTTTWLMKDPAGSTYQPFSNGDILLIQKYNLDKSAVKLIYRVVNGAPSGRTLTLTTLAGAPGDTGTPEKGDEVVRIGNNGNTANRDASVYLSSDDTNSPYLRINSGVTNYTTWTDGSALRAQFGNLNGTYGYSNNYYGFGAGKYASGYTNITVDEAIGLRIRNYTSTLSQFGDLNGYYGYSGSTYGVAIGTYGSNQPNVTLDATNGLRIRNYTTTLGQWDISGNVLIGQTGAGQSNIYITSGALQLRNNTTPVITLNSDGTGTFAGSITSSATITGGAIYTASSGQRITINETAGTIKLYSNGLYETTPFQIAATNYGAYIKLSRATGIPPLSTSADGNFSIQTATGTTLLYVGYIWPAGGVTEGNLIRVNTDIHPYSDNSYNLGTIASEYGTDFRFKNLYLAGSIYSGAGTFLVNSSGQLTKINNVVTSGYVPISNGTHYEPRALTVSDVTNAASTAGSYANPSWITSLDKSKVTGLTASTISGATAGGALTSTSFLTSILFDPGASYGEFIEANSSTTITMDGTNYVKFTGTATGNCGSGITYSATNDNLTVDASVTGKYRISYSITGKADTAGEYYWGILKNDALVTGTETRQILNHVAINTNYSTSSSAIVSLSDGDTIAIGCYGTNGRVVTVTYINVNIIKISN